MSTLRTIDNSGSQLFPLVSAVKESHAVMGIENLQPLKGFPQNVYLKIPLEN